MNELHIERINLVVGQEYNCLVRKQWSDDNFEKTTLTFVGTEVVEQKGPIYFGRCSGLLAYYFKTVSGDVVVLTSINSYSSSTIDACYLATNLSDNPNLEYCFVKD